MLLGNILPILPVQILWVNMVSAIALTVPLAFEPKSKRAMRSPPRPPNEPILSGSLLRRILLVSAWNAIVTFGAFEWILQTTNNVDLARTVAINALVSTEIFYLLSISKFIPSVFANLQGNRESIGYGSAIGIGCLAVLQILFCQWSVINQLFDTTPLSYTQGLFSIGVGLPVIVLTLLLQRFDPMN